MALTRVQRSLAFALFFLGAGGAAAVYTLKTKVKTPDERFREEREAMRLFHFGRVHVVKGKLTTKTATFTFARDDTYKWTITEPVAWAADIEALEAMIDRMAGVVVDPVITEAATAEELARSGLDAAASRLEVELESGAKHTLFVGPKNPMVDKFPITDEHKKRVGLSTGEFVWALERNLFEFRDKKIFPFKPESVTKVRIDIPEGMQVDLQLKEEGWRAQGLGVEGEIVADEDAVAVLLTALTKRLKVERFVTDAYTDAEAGKYALAPPARTITVTTNQGNSRTAHFAEILETSADEGTAIAHLAGSTSIAALRGGVVEAFAASAASFRDRTLSRFSPSALRKVRIEIAGEPSVTLVKKGDAWVTDDVASRAAKVWRVDAVVRPFARLRVHEWKTDASTPAQRREWLLEPWSRRIVIYGEGDAVLSDIRIGTLADDAHVFAMAEGDTRVGVVEVRKVRAFPAKVEEFFTE